MTHIVTLDQSEFISDVLGTTPIDISPLTGAGDYVSVALPAFPSTKVIKATSFIDITSNVDGDFASGPTDSIPFSSSSPALPGGDGNAEMRLPLTLFTQIDRTAITGVRFRLDVSASCTFRCQAIRACSENWEYPPLDIDTLYDRMQRPPSPNGSATPTLGFPSTAMGGMPANWPIVFRADDSPDSKDPRPIDGHVSVNFTTGGINCVGATDADRNIIKVYFREVPTDTQIQLELDELTQAEMDARGAQPTFGNAVYTAREQEDLDLEGQSELDTETQFDLERLPDWSTHSWLVVTLKWSDDGTELSITDADDEGYTFEGFPLLSNTVGNLETGHYILFIDLERNSVRARIYATDSIGNIDTSEVIFDSGSIVDQALAPRWKGRFGWWAQLIDGDAFVDSIRPRGFTFAEAITHGFGSNTPVDGVQLFAGSTADLELFEEVSAAPWGVESIGRNPSVSKTGKAYEIVNRGGLPLQGIMTNLFFLDSIEDLKISFDLFFPTAALEEVGTGLDIFLLGEFNRIVTLNHTPLEGDAWEKVLISLRDDLIQTGFYRLVLVQSLTDTETTWWVENISIKEPVVKWTARGARSDAWHMNDDNWIPFRETLNELYGGVVFRERGSSLQIRAEARHQQAEIYEFKAVPKYAELGRFVWNDEIPSPGIAPVANLGATISGRTVAFSGLTSTDADNQIIAYHWSFGDDTYAFGPQVSHTFELAGTYRVVLTVIDSLRNHVTDDADVTVA